MLTSALIARAKTELHIDAFEIDAELARLSRSLLSTEPLSTHSVNIQNADLIKHYSKNKTNNDNKYDIIILNPPYKKLTTKDKNWFNLKKIGISAHNYYSAFLEIALNSAKENGQIIAIIPRSFCNGYYFKSLRNILIKSYQIASIHLIKSRDTIFHEDSVLQENVIIKLIKSNPSSKSKTCISQCNGDLRTNYKSITLDQAEITSPCDSELHFRLIVDIKEKNTIIRMDHFKSTLESIGFSVSTGKIVDFRLPPGAIINENLINSYPLLYPINLQGWRVKWPVKGPRGSLSIKKSKILDRQLFKLKYAVLVKRFTSSEERRRIVASAYVRKNNNPVGIENHINVITHTKIQSQKIINGLMTYLNSAIVDRYYRIISGHTQVNAIDLKNLPCPELDILLKIGEAVNKSGYDHSHDCPFEKLYSDAIRGHHAN